jgi:diguanylate cyclase (GGDEF)-like protein
MTGRPKVLIVDDEPENLELLLRALRKQYEVETAADGQEGREKLKSFAPDLIITDQRMPNLDGVGLLEEARKTSPDTLRIMVTGYTDTVDLVAAINRGQVWRYVVKPFAVDELKIAVQQAIERVQMIRERDSLLAELSEKNARLEKARGELEAANEGLEKRVAERTAELGAANAELKTALAQVSELARTDALTGLSNRRYFEEVLERELARALRFFRPLGLVVLDLDHFKAVNDTSGHAAGDKVLKEFGAVLQSCSRTTDFAARIGGEEFVLLLPETPIDGAEVIAARVRKTLEFQSFATTVSAGIAACPDHGTTPGDLFEAADRALYRAKGAGRNRTERADGLRGVT